MHAQYVLQIYTSLTSVIMKGCCVKVGDRARSRIQPSVRMWQLQLQQILQQEWHDDDHDRLNMQSFWFSVLW